MERQPDVSISRSGEKKESYFSQHNGIQAASKLAVARYVATERLKDGDSILLDAGTSTYPIADEIVRITQLDPGRGHFTIMTHNYMAFDILIRQVPRDANLNIILAGGRYDQDLNALFGLQTLLSYEEFYPKVVVIAVSGMVANVGLFCHGNTEELPVKQNIFAKGARDRVVIADHTKLGVQDGFLFGKCVKLREGVEKCYLVTDEPPRDADNSVRDRFQREMAELKRMGIIVEVAPVPAVGGTTAVP